jgi:DNA-binding beta-propeller fold protein YncE
MRRSNILAACYLGAACVASAQIGAPQLGWIPDGARIRPVYGLPAAAAVGPAIPADQDFSQIAASPARNYVLVSTADTGIVSVYTLEHGLVPLANAGSAPDSVTLSPRGSSAALWYSSINQIQVVTGLPNAPAIRQLDASLLGSAPAALAVSDDGTWLTGAAPGAVYAFGPNGEVNRLPVENAASVAFFQGTHDVALANSAGVQMLTGIGGFAMVSSLLASADSSLQPVAVAATSDNKTVVLADQSGSLTIIDVASGTASASDCGCQPVGLFGMAPSAFRLTGLDAGAFKLFDAASGQVLFVPLALADTEGAGQ